MLAASGGTRMAVDMSERWDIQSGSQLEYDSLLYDWGGWVSSVVNLRSSSSRVAGGWIRGWGK